MFGEQNRKVEKDIWEENGARAQAPPRWHQTKVFGRELQLCLSEDKVIDVA